MAFSIGSGVLDGNLHDGGERRRDMNEGVEAKRRQARRAVTFMILPSNSVISIVQIQGNRPDLWGKAYPFF